MRSHVGVSPSGKATDSDSVIVGSNPATPAIFLDPLAQSVEHLTFNQVVGGSNPPCFTPKRPEESGLFFVVWETSFLYDKKRSTGTHKRQSGRKSLL